MYLTKSGIVHKNIETVVAIEKVAENLIMVTITNQLHSKDIPSYWRLTGSKGNPPLEIGVNCKEKCISEITFWVDPARIIRQYNFIAVKGDRGNILIDTNIFRGTNDYIDVNQEYSVYLHANKLICLFQQHDKILCANKNGRLEVYMNEMNEVIGFAVCDLLDSEIFMFA